MKKKKRKKGERANNVDTTATLPTSANTSAVRLAKDLNHEEFGKFCFMNIIHILHQVFDRG